MTALYRADDPALLISVLNAEGVHLEPGAILEGLTAEHAHAKPHGLPHSIAEIVAHICFWQEWFNNCALVGFTGIAAHAVDGWPVVPPNEWDALRTRYLDAIAAAKRIAAESDSLAHPVLPSGLDIPILARESYGAGLLHGAVHASHHLGQIITIRQLLGLWPPPSGTLAW
jgi:uncharacterized damage-inducible protein DinB